MIRLNCASCGQSVPVESLLTAAEQTCPHCGQYLISGGRPQTAAAAENPPSGTSTEASTPTAPPAATARTNAYLLIVLLAILSFLLGGLQFFGGLVLIWFSNYLQGPEGIALLANYNLNQDQFLRVQRVFQQFQYVAMGLVTISPLMIYAGISLLRCERTGWYLGLGFACVAAMSAIVLTALCQLCLAIFYAGYAVLAFNVLLRYQDEFKSETADEESAVTNLPAV